MEETVIADLNVKQMMTEVPVISSPPIVEGEGESGKDSKLD